MAWPGFYAPPPSSRERRWVEDAVGSGARVIRTERLGGGTASAVNAVLLRLGSGLEVRLVLRRHLRAEVLADEPDIAEREGRVLSLVASAGVPAPRLVAIDPTGTAVGVPAVLMTWVPGRLELQPRDVERWLRGFAELLPAIHAVDPGDVPLGRFELWEDPHAMSPPAWTRRRAAWERIYQVARAPFPAFRPTFIHRDYNPYNVLRRRGRAVAAVDWHNALLGPAPFDAAYLRVQLAADYGIDVARSFKRIYREITGEPVDPRWDAYGAFPATGDGNPGHRSDLDDYVAEIAAEL
jgi:aminoglycoside phosphotransferase (APT) family kinase protein